MNLTWAVQLPADTALTLLDYAAATGLAMTAYPTGPDGRRTVTFGDRTRSALASLNGHHDGVIDGDAMWIGGVDYPITPSQETCRG